METNTFPPNDDLLDYLFKLSGASSRELSGNDFKLVCACLWHDQREIRERAVYIGGLRCLDKTINCALKSILLDDIESCDDIRRLMVESVVSFYLERSDGVGNPLPVLKKIMEIHPKDSLSAKAAYVGGLRVAGKLSKREFASLDYDDVVVP